MHGCYDKEINLKIHNKSHDYFNVTIIKCMIHKYFGLGKTLDVYDSFNYTRGQDKSS